jgi:hypothetical protein
VERRYNLDGAEIYTENLMRAYSTDGFVDVIRRSDPNGNLVDMKTIVNYVEAQRVVVDPLTESRTTYNLTPGDVRAYQSLETECSSQGAEETKEILGYSTTKKVIRIPDSKQPVY